MTTRIRRRTAQLSTAAALVLTSLLLAAQSDGKIDVTGSWALEVNTDAAGTTTPSVTLKQDGTKLTGHYSSATLGEADVTGSINGRAIAFSFTAQAQGLSIDVTYTGTVETKDTMKGKISLGGLGEGTFTGKRK